MHIMLVLQHQLVLVGSYIDLGMYQEALDILYALRQQVSAPAVLEYINTLINELEARLQAK